MTKLKLTEHIFLIFHEGQLILWDYQNHNQYEIDQQTLLQLLQAAKGVIDEQAMQALIANKLLVAHEPKITWGWDKLSQIYHIGTTNLGEVTEQDPQAWLEQYMAACEAVDTPQRCLSISGPRISLPPHSLDQLPAINPWAISKRRMTNRVFTDKAITLEQLVNVLYAGFGIIEANIAKYTEKVYQQPFVRKAHPSGGGLHPLECFVLIYKVTGLAPGLYYYNWDDHVLIDLSKTISIARVIGILQGQYYVRGISCGLLICNNNIKSWKKYKHSRCYRDIFIDLGHAQQTILYYATAQGLETWQTCWFREQELSELIGIDGQEIYPGGFIGLGHGTRESIPVINQT